MSAFVPLVQVWLPVAALTFGILLTITEEMMPAFPVLRTVLGFAGMMLCFGGLQLP